MSLVLGKARVFQRQRHRDLLILPIVPKVTPPSKLVTFSESFIAAHFAKIILLKITNTRDFHRVVLKEAEIKKVGKLGI